MLSCLAMTDENDRLVDAVAGVLPPLLDALDGLEFAARNLRPEGLERLRLLLSPLGGALRRARPALDEARWPDRLGGPKEALCGSADAALEALARLEAAGAAGDMQEALRGARARAAALERLYALAPLLPPVSRFFLDPPARGDEARLERLARPVRPEAGAAHFGNGRGERGGWSLFVPEDLDRDAPAPLVMALHGGGGHGRQFLWSWLRAARTAGAILVAPTSTARTWPLMGADRDTPRLLEIVAQVRARQAVDPQRLLLTGMSDGATFSYVSALPSDGPWTHLAPFAGAFHPMLLEFVGAGRLRGLPIYLAHGALDWMFPVGIARAARDAFSARGAAVAYRELPDLAHAFPTEECAAVLAWLKDTPRGTPPATPGDNAA